VEELTWEPVLYEITRLVDHDNPHKENDFYVHLVQRSASVVTHDDVYVLDMGHKVRERERVVDFWCVCFLYVLRKKGFVFEDVNML